MTVFVQFLIGLLIAATAVQLLAWLGLFARLAWCPCVLSLGAQTQNSKLFCHPRRGQNSKLFCHPRRGQDLKLSVIICARNEADNLRQNLPFVLEQEHPGFEVVVVDDDSSDGTPAILQDFQQQYTHLRVLRIAPKTTPGKKHALAQGIAAAKHELLVLTDADCRPASNRWLAVLSFAPCGGDKTVLSGLPTQNSKQFCHPRRGQNSKPEILLGYAPYRPAPGLLNRWVRFETVQTAMQYFSLACIGQPYMGVGRNLAWRRSIFDRVGGFSAHADLASGDDDLLVNAAATARNTAICLNPDAFVYSDAENTWRNWLRQKRRHLSAGTRYRRQHQLMLGALALSHTLHYFLLIPLAFVGFGTICVSCWAIRMAPAFLIYWKILRQFREERLLLWFPLLDALLAFYYAAFVPPVLIRSNSLISWK